VDRWTLGVRANTHAGNPYKRPTNSVDRQKATRKKADTEYLIDQQRYEV
jgi:hypothetical protein